MESPAPPTITRPPEIAAAPGNTFWCLIRFALANIKRRPERFVLSVLGIALAIACVTVVRTIAASFAITGEDSVTDVIGDAQLWVVPAAGVHYDNDAQALVAAGPAPTITTVPDGWSAVRTLSGTATVNGIPVSIRGADTVPAGHVTVGEKLATRLGVHPGDRVTIGGQNLAVDIVGSGQSASIPTELARSVVGDNGWWTITAPAGQEKRRDLAQVFGAATGLPATTDPSVQPAAGGQGLIYDTVG